MEVNPKPTPEGVVPGDYPNKTKPSRPFIGDIPGEGSEGPTDIPNKEIHPNRPYIGDIPGEGSHDPAAIREVIRRRWKDHGNPDPLTDIWNNPTVEVGKLPQQWKHHGNTYIGDTPEEGWGSLGALPPLEDPPAVRVLKEMLQEKSEIGVTGGGPFLENPPLEDPPYIKPLYRGQQFGRKGHFGSGHQK